MDAVPAIYDHPSFSMKYLFMIKRQQKTFSLRSFFWKLMQNHKKVLGYTGSFLLMAAVFGSLTIMRTSSTDLLKLIQFLAFFGMGCVNATALQGESGSFLSRNYFLGYLLYTLLISGVICLFLTGIYYISNSDKLMAFSSACAFLVPFLLTLAWFFYKHIPKNYELAWSDSETLPDELALSFRNKIPIRFQVSREYFDMKEIEFPVTVSSWVKLGILFHQFILEQNKNESCLIELTDEDQYQYSWEFYAESMGGFISRQLDPKLNVRENKIIQNSTIVARRIRLKPEVEHDEVILPA